MTKKEPVPVKRRVITRDFKLQVLREIAAGKSQAQAARDYQVTETAIYKWRLEYAKYKDKAFSGNGRPHTDEARINELERMVGRLTMENDFLKKLLQKLEADS
jgi:transposase-like protein